MATTRNTAGRTPGDISDISGIRDQGTPQRSKTTLRYRSVTNGYWVTFLLPLAIQLSGRNQSTTAVAIIMCEAVVLSFVRHWNVALPELLLRLRRVYLALFVLIASTVWILTQDGGKLYATSSYLVLFFTFPYVFYNTVKQHPKSFSFGEGILITSGFVYRFWGASQDLPYPPTDTPIYSLPEHAIISMFLQLAFFGTILGARIILLLQKPWKLFILEELLCLWSKYCILGFFARIPSQSDEISTFLILWPFKFLFATELRFRLIVFWMTVSFFTGIYLLYKIYTPSQRPSTSIDRKVFHFSIVFVFLPGIFWDHALIFCCSAVLLYIFVLVETARVLKFETLGMRIGETINEYVRGFRDHQDEGRLLMTPIYLLAGCSLPIWLTGLPEQQSDLQPIQFAASLAGVLSIGIGDTFASIGGSYYGRTNWPQSRKTVEGTVCSIIAQTIVVALIFISNVLPYTPVSVASIIVAIVVNAVVEGVTDQIDNLVLPLVAFCSVHLTSLMLNRLDIASTDKWVL